MKKYLLPLVYLFCGIFLLQSCQKPEHETAYVTVNETVKSGETYSLDLSKYADAITAASITTQAANFAVSQVDRDPSTAKYIYHFSIDTKQQSKETVVINLAKGGQANNSGGCNHDNKNGKTVVTVNLTVVQ